MKGSKLAHLRLFTGDYNLKTRFVVTAIMAKGKIKKSFSKQLSLMVAKRASTRCYKLFFLRLKNLCFMFSQHTQFPTFSLHRNQKGAIEMGE